MHDTRSKIYKKVSYSYSYITFYFVGLLFNVNYLNVINVFNKIINLRKHTFTIGSLDYIFKTFRGEINVTSTAVAC